MKKITFIDTEVSVETNRILDIGAVKINGESLHTESISKFRDFINGDEYLCGHNIINHDMKFLTFHLIQQWSGLTARS